jgi:coatomer subunit beta
MRFPEIEDSDLANSFRAEAMLIMSSIIRIGQSHFVKTQIDEDSIHRIMTCFRALLDSKHETNVKDAFLKETKSVYTTMLSTEDRIQKEKAQQEKNASAIQVDDIISIRQLSKKKMDNKIIDEV